MSQLPAVQIRGLNKSYGNKRVLENLDLTVSAGTVISLLGPNGTGKTTVVEILQGLRRRGGGTISVLGEDLGRASRTWRARIGVVSQASADFKDLTVTEAVTHIARFFARPTDIAETIDRVGLSDDAHICTSRLSGGRRRRLDVALTAEFVPDVILMDLYMPGLDGVEANRRISAGSDAPRVVVLTTYDTDGDILRAVEAGANGYLLKDFPREDILAAVLSTAVGRSMLSPAVTTRLVGVARGTGHGADGSAGRTEAPVTLSPRERQVLQVASRGLSNSQIGAELYITEATVKTHLLRAYAKFGVDSRTAAVTEALRRGLLELD